MSSVQKVQDLRKGNRAQPIPARRKRRQGSRSAAKRAAVKEGS